MFLGDRCSKMCLRFALDMPLMYFYYGYCIKINQTIVDVGCVCCTNCLRDTRGYWPSSLVINQGSSNWAAGIGAQVHLHKENLYQGLNFQLKSQESHRTWMAAFSEFNSWSLCSHN